VKRIRKFKGASSAPFFHKTEVHLLPLQLIQQGFVEVLMEDEGNKSIADKAEAGDKDKNPFAQLINESYLFLRH